MTQTVRLISHENKRDLYEVPGGFLQVTGEETGQVQAFRLSPARIFRDMRYVPLNGVLTVSALTRKEAAQIADLAHPNLRQLGH